MNAMGSVASTTFGVPPPATAQQTPVAPGFGSFFLPLQQQAAAGAGPAAMTPQQQHTPLGSLVAAKAGRGLAVELVWLLKSLRKLRMAGDLIYPIVNVGFFVIGVVMVVKVLLSLLALFKAKLSAKLAPVLMKMAHDVGGCVDGADDCDDGDLLKRRSIDSLGHLDGLTSVVMSALDSQQCLQRMTCELGSWIRQFDKAQLVSDWAVRLAPDEFTDQVRAFQKSADGDCTVYRCGRRRADGHDAATATTTTTTSSKDSD